MSAMRWIGLIGLSVCYLAVGIASAYANDILHVRAFSNDDKTRVVLDLDFEPKYSSAINNDGENFVVRVNDVTNYKNAPDRLNLEARSAIKKFTKNLSGDDVRYIFDLEGAGTPNIFLLKPMEGRNYRLVIDFPHTATVRQPANPNLQPVKVIDQKTASQLKGKGQGAGFPPVKVVTIADADAAEDALLNSLSTVGSDGIRTMTPQQVRSYQEQMEQKRAQEAAQKAFAEQNSKTAAVAANVSNNKVSNAINNAGANANKGNAVANNKNNASNNANKAIASTNNKRPSLKTEEEVQDTPAPPSPLPMSLPQRNPFVIAIDAGHGGKDPGATGKRGVKEKNVTLAIASQLEQYVNSNKRFRGYLIRKNDVFVDLDRRSAIARGHKADVLISIHADSVAAGGESARGVSVWVLSNNRAQRENTKFLQGEGANSSEMLSGVSEILSGTDQQNPYLAATILSMSSDNTRSEGYNLGQEILNKVGDFTKLHKKQPIHASLAVLKAPDIPSLLIETGFLSNPQEEIQLNQPNYQKQIAYRIYQGIISYYEKYAMQRYNTRMETAIRTNTVNSIVHTVQKGDSLSVLAQNYKSSVKLIKELNKLKSDNIWIGQKLRIPQMR